MSESRGGHKGALALKKRVILNDGILTVSMQTVREATQAGESTKVYIRKHISEQLAQVGLVHSGNELPIDSQELVRLYLAGSQIARIIEAASNIDKEGHFDEILRELVKN